MRQSNNDVIAVDLVALEARLKMERVLTLRLWFAAEREPTNANLLMGKFVHWMIEVEDGREIDL